MKEIPQVPLRGATVYTDWEGPRTHADNTRFADPHACWNAPASLIHHLVSVPRGVTLDAEHRDEDASGSLPPVALCIHHSFSEGDVMNAFHGSFLLGEEG